MAPTERTFAFALLLTAVMLTSCARDHQSIRYLSNRETTRCTQVAMVAAGSPAMWEKLKAQRLSTEPLKIDETKIECDRVGERGDRVQVILPSGGHIGLHSCYIRVTVAHDTYEVLELRESCWW